MSGATMRSSRLDKNGLQSSSKESDSEDQTEDENRNPFKQKPEKGPIEPGTRRKSAATSSKLRFAVLVVSWVTVVSLVILGTLTLVMAFTEKSSSAFAFALDAGLDCLSSIVIIIRYFRADSIYEDKKEAKACIILGVLFLVSSVTVMARASISIAHREHPFLSSILWCLSLVSGVICAIFFVVKSYLAYQLSSVSVATDAANSFIGMLLAISTLVSDIAFEEERRLWYIDAIFGIICAVFLFLYGVMLIIFQSKNLQELNKQEEYQELKD